MIVFFRNLVWKLPAKKSVAIARFRGELVGGDILGPGMFRHEIQLLSRRDGDYHFHRNAVLSVGVSGKVGFRSYFFAGRKCLVILLETQQDVDAVLDVLPRYAAISVREIPLQAAPRNGNSASAA